jgi:hypothetical protein
MREAIALHLAGLRVSGQHVPAPLGRAGHVSA